MSRGTRPASEQERLRDQRSGSGSIELGTVGWGDGEDRFAPEVEGEPTLVKVTLFRGRRPDVDGEAKEDRAQGQPTLCRVAQPLNYIPPEGGQVMVAIPAGFELTPGVGVIFAAMGPTTTQFGTARAKMDFGPDVDLILKAKSVTLSDYEDRYLTLGPDFGFKVGDATASGLNLQDGKWLMYVADGGDAPDCKGVFEIDQGLVRCQAKAGAISGFEADGGGTFTVSGVRFCAYTDGGMLGRNAIPTNLVTYQVVGVPPPVPTLNWSIGI
jgi:hypothetical protein